MSLLKGLPDSTVALTDVYRLTDKAHADWLNVFSVRFLLLAGACLLAAWALRRLAAPWRTAAVIGAGLVLRLAVALKNPYSLAENPLYDDSFYCFSIARNLALGNGLMHDSYNWTSGFQPLFVFLIAPVFRLVGDPTIAISCVLALQSLLGAAGGCVLAETVALLTRRTFFHWALSLWAFSPVFVKTDVNGLETNLSFLLFSTTIYWYLKHYRGEDRRAGPHVVLGVLLGLCFLARVDNVFLAAALVSHTLYGHFGRKTLARGVGKAGLTAAGFLLVSAPWLVYCTVVGGSPLPTGGQAVRFLSLAYGPRAVMGEAGAGFPGDLPPLGFYVRLVWLALRSILQLFNGVFPLRFFALILVVWGLRHLGQLRTLGFLALYCALMFAAYTGYIFGPWFFSRYFFPFVYPYVIALFLIAHAALPAGASPDDRRGRRRQALLSLAGIGGVVLALSWTLTMVRDVRLKKEVHDYYIVSEFIKAKSPKDVKLGFVQSGIMGYNCERTFLSLDGKTNSAALDALRERRIDRYIEAAGLDYLVDYPQILRDIASFARDEDYLDKHEFSGPIEDIYLVKLK